MINKTPRWWKGIYCRASLRHLYRTALSHPSKQVWERKLHGHELETVVSTSFKIVCKTICLHHHHTSLPTFTRFSPCQDQDSSKRSSDFPHFFGIALDGWDPCLARQLAGILTYRPELLEAWLVLTSINYKRNVWVSILLYLWLALTMFRASGPRVITQFIFNVIQQLLQIQIYFSKE